MHFLLRRIRNLRSGPNAMPQLLQTVLRSTHHPFNRVRVKLAAQVLSPSHTSQKVRQVRFEGTCASVSPKAQRVYNASCTSILLSYPRLWSVRPCGRQHQRSGIPSTEMLKGPPHMRRLSELGPHRRGPMPQEQGHDGRYSDDSSRRRLEALLPVQHDDRAPVHVSAYNVSMWRRVLLRLRQSLVDLWLHRATA